MKEINKDIVKKHQIGCWDYVKQLAAYKCMIELLSSNRRIDPSNGFGPLGAVKTLHLLRHKRQKINHCSTMSRQHCQTNSHLSCTLG
jgi:hypothetical protein